MTEDKSEKKKIERRADSMALNYISYRDRSVLEMQNYLEKKEFSQDEIERCLKNLTEWGLLDDQDFCRKFIKHSKDKERGSIRIRYDLKHKGIGDEIIESCMAEELTGEEEMEIALAIGEKILSQETSPQIDREDGEAGEGESRFIDERLKGKIARRLASRGFSGNIVYAVINKLKP